MTSVYQHDKAKSNDIKQHQWVRIKAGGVYKDDVGLVEGVVENKVWIRLVPRIEITKSGDTKNASKRSMFSKVPQKPNLKPQNIDGAVQQKDPHTITNSYMYQVKGQLMHRGFVYKAFAFKQLEVGNNVKPSFEELQMFKATLANGAPDDDDGADEDQRDNALEVTIQKTLMQGGETVYMKGDKISVHRGEYTGMRGTVIEIEGGFVTFKSIDFPDLDPQQVDIAFVTKYFEPGDLVRVTEGKYRGETGQVVDVQGNRVSMVLD